jgi:hypothetical protein
VLGTGKTHLARNGERVVHIKEEQRVLDGALVEWRNNSSGDSHLDGWYGLEKVGRRYKVGKTACASN